MPDIITAAREFIASPHYFETTPRQLAMLGIVCDEPGPHSVKALARSMSVAKPVICRAADKLLELGLVTRSRCVTDKRVVYVVPTDKGEKFREAVRNG